VLIFVKGEYLDQIKRGEKTATLRPWKTCRMKPGDPLVFNGKVHATLTRVVQRELGTLSAADIQAEGFATREDFRRAVRRLYPTLTSTSPCVVLHFRLSPRRRPE
jgi:hypothetical protein